MTIRENFLEFVIWPNKTGEYAKFKALIKKSFPTAVWVQAKKRNPARPEQGRKVAK